jgi:hypothetical protein
MKKEWKKYTDVRQSVFQNHFSETNSKRSIEEKAAVTSSMKDSLFFFFARMNVSWSVFCGNSTILGNTEDASNQ